MGTTYTSLEAFYSADEARRRSPEWDFGLHWHASHTPSWPRWRVSWVIETGELYALQLGGSERVTVLGIVPKVGDYPYGVGHDAWQFFAREQEIEQILNGWEDEPTRPLSWITERLADLPLTGGRLDD